jgi:asparagine synthase (glutamine-hydrolysing)
VKTFSVGVAGQRHSELPYAAQVAKEFGTAHHEMVVSQQDLMGKLAALVACRDAPVAEPSDIPLYMLACEAARSVKVVLTGEGSDELLGGHSKHVLERYAWSLRLLPRVVRRGLIAPLGVDDWRERYVRWFGALDRAECDRLAGPVLNGAAVLDARPPFDAASGASRLRRALYFDQVSWLPDNLLERADRMTMAASIEARVPFLDHRLAEYVSALPDTLRVRGLRTKWILRQAGRSLIPRRIRKRPKAGLRVPANEWFRREMRGVLLEHLAGSASLTRPYYNAGVLDRVMDEHLKGRQDHEKLLWMLLNLEIWHRTYRNA